MASPVYKGGTIVGYSDTPAAPGVAQEAAPTGGTSSGASYTPLGTTRASTPSAFSSTAGADLLTKSTQQATKLAGAPAGGAAGLYQVEKSGTPEGYETIFYPQGKNPDASLRYPGSPAPSGTRPEWSPAAPSSMTMVNPESGQEYTLTSPDEATIKKFKDNGWSVADGSGDGTGIISADPAVKAAQDATERAKGELDNAKNRLTSFAPSLANDPMLLKIMSSITADWDARMQEMSKYNESATAAMRTTAYRNGLQYTGGAGGTWGGVISAEERFGVDRLATLEAEKQAALTNATFAYEKQKWTEYSDLVDRAQSAYDSQANELLKLQGAAQAQSQKIATARRQSDLEGVIGNIVSQGMTDPGEIQAYLRSTGAGAPDASLKEISDALKILNPAADLTGLSSDYRTFKYLQDRKDPSVKGLDYFGFVRSVHNAGRAGGSGGGGTGTPGGNSPKITWDAFLGQQEEKMKANIIPGSDLYNKLHAEWEKTTATTGTSPFTKKDQANGAQNAGLNISDFPTLPVDVQNFYVKAPQAQVNALNKELAAIRAGTETAENAKKWVADSQITDAMKDYLNRKIDEMVPAGGGGAPGTEGGGGGLMNTIENGLGTGWHALANFMGI